MDNHKQQIENESKELGARIAVLLFGLFPEETERQKVLSEIEALPENQLPAVLDWLEARQAAIAGGIGAVLDSKLAGDVSALKEDYDAKQEALSIETLGELESLEKELED